MPELTHALLDLQVESQCSIDVVNRGRSLQEAQAQRSERSLGLPYSPNWGRWMRVRTQTSSSPHGFLMVS